MDERNHKAMNKKLKGYWVICQQSYEVDGICIPKGRMDFHESPRPIQNKDWRRATQEEINTKKYRKGNVFNLRNVSITEISKKQIMNSLMWGSYKANRGYGLTHEQLLSIGIGNDLMKQRYEKETANP